MEFKYYRIQGKELAPNTKTGKGIFSMLRQMASDGVMDEEDDSATSMVIGEIQAKQRYL